MTRSDTPFDTDRDLIVVEVHVTGPLGSGLGRFVLDTGAVATTMIPELAHWIGYSERDAFKRTKVHTAIGEEERYVVHVAELAVFGFAMPRFPVNVFDLGHEDIHGLLGMNLLSDLNFEIRPAEQRILVEKIAP